MKHLKKFNENLDNLESKLDEIYNIIKTKIKDDNIEDFYLAEDFIYGKIMPYLKDKLWNDSELESYMKGKEFGTTNENVLAYSDHRKAKFAIRKNLDFMKEMEQVFYNHGEVMDLSIINEAYSELENLNEDELLEIYESVSSNVGPSYDNNTLKDSVILKLLEYFGF